ncbi:hypothetical protein Bca101_091952 [Brassica carinata]
MLEFSLMERYGPVDNRFFHGADVRENFLSHIVKEFKSKAIDLFIDNDIERSKSIGPELLEAIRGSRIAIVLLSRNYAWSIWWLNELVEIIKCREEVGQTVMSLFYQVDPTHVKKQTGDFGKVFRKTCKGKTKEEIRRWKHALTEVAQIPGFHSTNGKNEAEMIEDIVSDVSNKLNLSAPSNDFDSLVGMESQMVNMGPLLQLDSDEKHFMSQLTNELGIKIPNLGIAKGRLKNKKVLVILDGVDRSVQVEAMAKEASWFGLGSRIIITTQDQKVLNASGINHIHKVNLPSYNEALQMFCMYAFGQKDPKDGFKELACEVISLVDSLPLGLRVMGSYFQGMSEKDWTEALPNLRAHLDRDGEIASILKFCYDALCDEDKRLFLHIACFFNYEKVDMVEGCLAKCFSDVRHGLRVLAEKSLISINMKKSLISINMEKSLISINMDWRRIEMATLLVQLGKTIVREQADNKPGNFQFLTDTTDIGEVLSDDKADSSIIIGINDETYEDIKCTSERAFERLYNLQFLRISSLGVNPRKFLVKLEMKNSKLKKLWEGMQPIRNLKWMDLSHSKILKELPNLSTATNLYDLDLRYCSSLVKLPSSLGNANNLKILNLHGCSSLVELLLNFETAVTDLKDIDLSHCSSLVKLSFSTRNAINLRRLNLSYCSSLMELPYSIWNATSIEELNLSHCSSLVKLPSSIGDVVNLKNLNLHHCSSLVELPSSIGNATKLQKLDLGRCSSLVKLPSSIGNATNLEELNLSHCSSLVKLPSSLGNLVNLKKLDLRKCSSLVELPSSIENAVNLMNLNLSYCSSLVELPSSTGNAISLRKLNLSHCSNLVELPSSIGNLTNLQELNLSYCSSMVELPSFIGNLVNIDLESIGELDLSNCSSLESYHESSTDIQEFDPWTKSIYGLRQLVLNGMKKLVSLPPLPDSLWLLDAENCDSLERLDCSFRNRCFCHLHFINCFKLNQEARDLISLTRTDDYAVFPAEEVPTCFPYRSSGSSLTLKLNQMPLASCPEGMLSLLVIKEYKEFFPGHLYTFEVEVETEEMTSTELVFEFEIQFDYILSESSEAWEIKKCGMLQLLEVPSC